ncbi:MAG TPA: Dabb family protein [Streptosporangiaceae bacterium]
MFHHVVVFTWKDDASEAQKAAVASELAKLPEEIRAVRRYEFGPDAGLDPANGDFAVVAAFDDADGYVAYRDHPAHRKVVENYLNPIVASRSRVQFEI